MTRRAEFLRRALSLYIVCRRKIDVVKNAESIVEFAKMPNFTLIINPIT